MVLRMAKTLGYRPNLAAPYLSSKTGLHIWVNTLQGTTSFWEEVRAGSRDEAAATQIENIKLDFQTYHQLGELQEEAFELAIANKVDGIITFPSHPRTYCPASRRRKHFDAPGTVVPKAI